MKKLLALPLIAAAAHAAAERPNILFILTDDMQAGAVSALGNDQTVTPNIDGIINSGTSVGNAYVNGGITGAISMPSRAMLLTGRTLFELQSDGLTIPESHTTMPQHLRANGYATFATGKWHSDKASFNRSFGQADNIFFGGMHRYELNGHRSPRLHHYDPTGRYENEFIGDRFSSEMYADAAIDFLNRRTSSDEPFFAYVAFTSPHDPRNNLPDYGYRYDWRMMRLPENFLPAPAFDNGELDVRDELIVPAPRSEESVRREMAFYYGMVSEVDQQIGRLVQTLKDNGLYDNTIIVFASDNGLAVGQHGLLGKQNLYQHSVNVPLAFAGPGIPAGKTTDAYCYLSDIFPTLCGMTGMEPPASCTARSVEDAVKEDGKGREPLMLAYSSIQRAVLKDSFKLIMYNVGGKVTRQLFDLASDPLEMNDLSGLPQYKAKVREYEKLLSAEMKRSGDFCDLGQEYWWGHPERISWKEAIALYTYE